MRRIYMKENTKERNIQGLRYTVGRNKESDVIQLGKVWIMSSQTDNLLQIYFAVNVLSIF